MKPTINPYDMLVELNTKVNLQEQYIHQLQINQMQLATLVQSQAKLLKDVTFTLHELTNDSRLNQYLDKIN